jgi:hypothetical protein
MKLFVPITKIDIEKRQVWGRAVQEVADRAREIFDYDSSKPLFEEWSSGIAEATKAAGQEVSLGNVRAMHGKVAAGKLSEITFNDAEKAIDVCSDVVDDNEWEKCQRGVYTGFSIGGDYVRKWNDEKIPTLKRYTAKPSEISLVDLPCVPTATFSMLKAAGVVEEHGFERYGVLSASLEKSDLTVGELLTLVQEYLPEDEIGALNKADATTGDFITRLHALVADAGTTIEKAAGETPAPAPTDAPAATTETVPTGSEGNEAAEKAVTPTPRDLYKAAVLERLRKGMWSVQDLAGVLQTVSWMASDAQWEADYEKDGSTVPADLRTWLALGVEIFKKMSAEETAEMITSLMPPDELAVFELSAGGDLGKKGARNSKGDQKKVQTLHDTAVDLGATCDAAEKAASPTGLFKVLGADRFAALGKAVALATGAAEPPAEIDVEQVDAVVAFAVAKAAENETLGKRVKDLEAMPVDGKGVLRIVGKSDDATELGKKAEPITPDPKDPKAVMKAVHAAGGFRVLG